MLGIIERIAPRALETILSRRSTFKVKALVAKRATTLHVLMSEDVPKAIIQNILDKASLWWDVKIASNIASE